MKIRTDFVTNSSSYCTTEVVIDNPVLLEVLQKYKDMGLFGNNEPIIGIGVYESQDAQFGAYRYEDQTKTPAFFYYEEQSDEHFKCLNMINYCDAPNSPDHVLGHIISIINSADKYLDVEIRTKLQEELELRKDEINRSYSNIIWKSGISDNYDASIEFKYDPISGSSYLYKDENTVTSTEIIIKNPVLLDILQKFKDKGLFINDIPIFMFDDSDGNYNHPWRGEYEGPKFGEDYDIYYYEEEPIGDYDRLNIARFCPKNLINVLEGLITMMGNGAEYLDERIFVQFKEELTLRKDEINQAYSRVYWSSERTKKGGKFEYDPINGESYVNVITTEIIIGNPLLLEILQKYKKIGLFDPEYPIFGIGSFIGQADNWRGYENHGLMGVPAFYYYEYEYACNDTLKNLARFCPERLENVLEGLISIMENGVEHLDEQILARLKEELTSRKDEIDQVFSKVYWSYLNESDSGKFEYDPINGESFVKGEE